MKTTIIEILNTIARGETPPKKIMWKERVYWYIEHHKEYFGDEDDEALFDSYVITDILNEEVIILETTITYKPDKIKKVNTYVLCDSDFHRKCDDGYSLCATEIIDRAFEEYSYKINEIIDRLNKDQI